MSAPVLSFRSESAGVLVDLDQLVGSRMLIQANSGGGKSRMLRYLLEQTHGRIPQIIIDPEGEFASLRERFPYLLAGRDGDVPADPKTAKVLCRRIAELGASAVIDIYELEMAARRKFVRTFLEELIHLPRAMWRPSLLVIDEAHLFCPERGAGEAESTQAVINACTLGRKRGIAAILATQRISKLHKDAAAELLNKLIGRTGLDVDVKRAGDELGFDKEQRQQLKFLEPGTFYAFGPAIAREVIEVRSGPITTTHPQPGKVAPPAPPPPAAIKKLVAQMQDLQAKADEEAHTEAELREQLSRAQRRVRELERGKPIAAAPDPASVQKQADAVQKQIDTAIAAERKRAAVQQQQHYREQIAVERQLRGQITDLSKRLVRIAEIAGAEIKVIPPAPEPDGSKVLPKEPAAGGVSKAFHEARTETRRSAPAAITTAGLKKPQQRILNAIATLHDLGIEQVDRAVAAALAGYKPGSGHVNNTVGELTSFGLVHVPAPGFVALTTEGASKAQSFELVRLDDYHAFWLALMNGPQQKLMEVLLAAYPKQLARDELAERAGFKPGSGHVNNTVGELTSMMAAEIPQKGYVRASGLLFPEALR